MQEDRGMGSESIILSAAVLLWLGGFVLFGRSLGRAAVGGAAGGGAGVRGSVTVIIPARNEAHNLPALLRSIAVQSIQPLEVLVVDDESSDGTAEVARELGARVIASQ